MAKSFAGNLFGRRRGKPLRQGRLATLERLLPRLKIEPGNFAPRSIDPRSLFDRHIETVWLEIGFGAGEHLAALAKSNPQTGFIGCEPFMNGVARLLTDIDQQGLDNIRIVMDDASLLLDNLKCASIGAVFLLFPDPWPKRRHKKRRFIIPKNIAEIGFSGHHLGIAVDIAAYTLGAKWIERHFTKDRTWKGTDHAASLEPAGLKKLIRDLNASYEALRYKASEILDIEKIQRTKLKSK